MRCLAQHDNSMAVRVRALASLHMFLGSASEALVRGTLASSSTSRTLKAAGFAALAGWDLTAREDLRALASAERQNTDIPIAIAAVQVLANAPEAAEALETRLSETPPAAVKQATRDAR